MKSGKAKGIIALLLTVVLWGSSFPAIKVVVSVIDEVTYTWARSVFALLGIFPYIIYYYRRNKPEKEEIIGGLVTGITFSLGLWLQGWGTRFTTASNSAFITGLNVVFVHVYEAIVGKEYTLKAFFSLLISIFGLYLLTRPKGGLGVGELLVLVGAIFWAAQIILISKFSRSNPIIFTFYETIPALIFLPLSLMMFPFSLEKIMCILPVLVYLGLVCGDIAFISQVYGQKWIKPYEVALIFLLEPVFASIFSTIALGERLGLLEILGASLIIVGMTLAVIKINSTRGMKYCL